MIEQYNIDMLFIQEINPEYNLTRKTSNSENLEEKITEKFSDFYYKQSCHFIKNKFNNLSNDGECYGVLIKKTLVNEEDISCSILDVETTRPPQKVVLRKIKLHQKFSFIDSLTFYNFHARAVPSCGEKEIEDCRNTQVNDLDKIFKKIFPDPKDSTINSKTILVGDFNSMFKHPICDKTTKNITNERDKGLTDILSNYGFIFKNRNYYDGFLIHNSFYENYYRKNLSPYLIQNYNGLNHDKHSPLLDSLFYPQITYKKEHKSNPKIVCKKREFKMKQIFGGMYLCIYDTVQNKERIKVLDTKGLFIEKESKNDTLSLLTKKGGAQIMLFDPNQRTELSLKHQITDNEIYVVKIYTKDQCRYIKFPSPKVSTTNTSSTNTSMPPNNRRVLQEDISAPTKPEKSFKQHLDDGICKAKGDDIYIKGEDFYDEVPIDIYIEHKKDNTVNRKKIFTVDTSEIKNGKFEKKYKNAEVLDIEMYRIIATESDKNKQLQVLGEDDTLKESFLAETHFVVTPCEPKTEKDNKQSNNGLCKSFAHITSTLKNGVNNFSIAGEILDKIKISKEGTCWEATENVAKVAVTVGVEYYLTAEKMAFYAGKETYAFGKFLIKRAGIFGTIFNKGRMLNEVEPQMNPPYTITYYDNYIQFEGNVKEIHNYLDKKMGSIPLLYCVKNSNSNYEYYFENDKITNKKLDILLKTSNSKNIEKFPVFLTHELFMSQDIATIEKNKKTIEDYYGNEHLEFKNCLINILDLCKENDILSKGVSEYIELKESQKNKYNRGLFRSNPEIGIFNHKVDIDNYYTTLKSKNNDLNPYTKTFQFKLDSLLYYIKNDHLTLKSTRFYVDILNNVKKNFTEYTSKKNDILKEGAYLICQYETDIRYKRENLSRAIEYANACIKPAYDNIKTNEIRDIESKIESVIDVLNKPIVQLEAIVKSSKRVDLADVYFALAHNIEFILESGKYLYDKENDLLLIMQKDGNLSMYKINSTTFPITATRYYLSGLENNLGKGSKFKISKLDVYSSNAIKTTIPIMEIFNKEATYKRTIGENLGGFWFVKCDENYFSMSDDFNSFEMKYKCENIQKVINFKEINTSPIIIKTLEELIEENEF
ncbi:MAG: hypothetical protein U0W65_10890 [Bacteroidia bacterium]